MTTRTIGRYMTASPLTIGADQPLSDAHRLMREHGIRHLPVLDGGRLVGLVSLRDLHFIETLKDVDPDEVEVSEAMSGEPYTVTTRTALHRAATRMATRKHDAAVVAERGEVVGVFTTTDALRALAALTRPRGRA